MHNNTFFTVFQAAFYTFFTVFQAAFYTFFTVLVDTPPRGVLDILVLISNRRIMRKPTAAIAKIITI